MLAGIPFLDSYRSRLYAAIIVAILAPLFPTALAVTMAADRMTTTTAFTLLALALIVGVALALWALHRMLAPLDIAVETIDAFIDQKPLPKVEVTGSDEAAQLIRGVQSLVSRLKTQNEQIRTLGERDDLTGLYQRRPGRSAAQALIEGAPKHGRTVRLYYVDIDRFGEINASRGPGFGDTVLKAVGARLARAAGDNGVAIRWGAAEFVVVHADLPESLAAVADLVRRPMVVKGLDLPVTVAVGHAETTTRESFEALLAR
ncbi:MAG: GGDEF domain-containing protein, partial [Aromatoleum sp.]|nr:GGDEF domain-containing protein [Aromatoleum sp.]